MSEEVIEQAPVEAPIAEAPTKQSITDILGGGKAPIEEAPAPTEEDNVTVSRQELEGLLAKLDTAAQERLNLVPKSATQATQAPVKEAAEQVSPAYNPAQFAVPQISQKPLSREEFYEITNDPEKFSAFLTQREQAVAAETLSAVMRNMPDQMSNLFGQMWDTASVTQKFIDRYPEMEKYPYQLAEEVSKIRRESPGTSIQNVMDTLEQRMTVATRLRKAMEGGSQVTVAPKGQFAPARTPARAPHQAPSNKPELTPTQQVLAEIKGLRSR